MDIILLIDENMDIALLKDNNITKKGDIELNGKCNTENNKLYVEWDNNTKQTYYLILDKYYTLNYINTNLQIFVILHEDNKLTFVAIDNILYNLDNIDSTLKFEIINDILIIYWESCTNYYEKNISTNIYNVISVPKYFDCNYYISNSKNLDIYDFDNWALSIKDYILYGRINNIPCYNQIEIILNNKMCSAIINHSHNHLLNLNNDKYHKIEINNDILKLNLLSFTFNENNEIVFEDNINNNITKTFIKNYHNIYEEINTDVNIKTNNIYIIGCVNNGGSNKYMNDLINHYPEKKIIHIYTNEELIKISFIENDILFIQNLFLTDITIQNILSVNSNIIISIHDFYWINSECIKEYNKLNCPWHVNYIKNIKISEDIIKLFNNTKYIIHPSIFTYNVYRKYFLDNNFILQQHNDIDIKYKNICVPKINNNVINIGILHKLVDHKGKKLIEYLIFNYKKYKSYDIKFLISGTNIPEYDELIDFNKYVNDYNIHCLPLLNIFGESYGYYLSKVINTGLPIIYNNIGSFKNRLNIKKKSYFKIEYDEKNNYDMTTLNEVFENLLDFIIKNNGMYNDINVDNKIYYNNLYDKLFL
jgi:hypothetical protein